MNRKVVYTIRKLLPDIPALHRKLAEMKLKEFRSQLLTVEQVQKGEADPDGISALIEACEADRGGQIRKLTEDYDAYLKAAGITYTPEEYESRRIRMLFDCLAYGFTPEEVEYYKLRERTLEQKKAYYTDMNRRMMPYIMSNFKQLQYVYDKAATYEKLGSYFKRELISINGNADFPKFEAFAKKHDAMVVKLVSDSCGHGISLVKPDLEHLGHQFSEILEKGKCSIEERIIQADVLAAFNPSSVNTARVISFQTRHGVQIGPCFFRTGRKGEFVDNAGSGGVFIGIDPKTGILNSDGHDEYQHVYEEHPDSGLVFRGFQLPDWEGCIALVKEMCAVVPEIGYIGWDLAYTDQGWIVVEANGASQMVSQIDYDQGCKPEIEQFIQDRTNRSIDLNRIQSDGRARVFNVD